MPNVNPFITKQPTSKMNLDVKTTLGKKPTKGEVGIEIEVEGKHLPGVSGTAAVPAPWVYHVDHSLRGQENGEYVLKAPIPFDKVAAALEKLWECFSKCKSKLDDSNRTSIHVHLNVQDWYFNRLCSFCALYYIVEIPLTNWCGEHRVGNLFCLRAVDAPGQVTTLKNFIMYDGKSKLFETLHYSALNTNALAKYGSLEIRTLRGCSDPTTILDWVETLQRLYELSAEFPDPRDVCKTLSSIGPAAFFDEILGDKAKVIRAGCGMSDNDITESVYTGIRIAQDLCYCRDWTDYKPTKIKDDPFGRSLKTVAKKLQSATSTMSSASVTGASASIPGEIPIPGQSSYWLNINSIMPSAEPAEDADDMPDPYDEPCEEEEF